ncbi:MAG: Plasmid stabilization system [Parcubacteria group bacterium GW2011_GWB1_41_6]|nr:MAG: Plasmid stabilization system [Parcubacteria group bacterium GW2011_GWB1_41_6]KKS34436.1 MAG: Plasmid stabilization system [Parcubacteria group bacterium GW2011_GWC2_42_13]KKS58255.1 MAG: Plasmid stabilization system [Parcubacteria group bacterium GW2011_GWA2_42_35]KKS71756.1 MAG: Plasmid stabilization system [Parcubacteria group bacterium GW2011_GWF2_42_7]
MRIFYSSRFLRSFKKLPKNIQDLFRVKESVFHRNPFDSQLKTHKLKGSDEWAFLITYKIRAIFILKGDIIILVNIGDHSIYRKK